MGVEARREARVASSAALDYWPVIYVAISGGTWGVGCLRGA